MTANLRYSRKSLVSWWVPSVWKPLVLALRCLVTPLRLCRHTFAQNNIAEVEELQADLLDEDLLGRVLSLMQDAQVDVEVRYFAGGILAQLASRPRAWTLSEQLLATITKQLVRVFVWFF